MTTAEIASRLAALCRAGEFSAAVNELYSEDAVSIEPQATEAFEKETKGLENLRAKDKKFTAMVEQMHAITVSEPLVAGNSFAFVLTMDITMKGRERASWSEICLYEVKDGKVVAERFFM